MINSRWRAGNGNVEDGLFRFYIINAQLTTTLLSHATL